MSREGAGFALGLAGVVVFSLTLPMTRLAVGTPALPRLDPFFVAIGRAAIAAVLAIAVLAAMRAPRPRGRQWLWLAATAAGVVFGFPVCTTWAMRIVPVAHGAVALGLLPLATALAGALLAGDRPSRAFWACAAAGSALVVAFALWKGAGALHPADWALFVAVVSAALGYACGSRLSGELGAVHVSGWVLVTALPLTAPLTLALWPGEPAAVPASAWGGFAYVALMSMYLGFFVWYRGLALGGVARVSQTQLVQPFLSMVFAVPILGERLDAVALAFAVAVIALVGIGRRMPIRRSPAPALVRR